MFDAEAPGDRRVARVLLDSALPQLDHLFDYAVPEHLASELKAGQRVRVPFRSQSRQSFGYIVEFVERSDFAGELQAISETVGPVPQMAPEVWRLARAVADRAGGSACDILRLAIPQRMVRVEKQYLAAGGAEIDPGQGAEEGGAGIRSSTLDETEAGGSETDAGRTDAGKTGTGSGAEFGAEAAANQPAETAAETAAERDLAELLVGGERVSITAAHGPERLGTGEWVGGWAVRLARAALAVLARGRSAIMIAPDYRDLDQLNDALEALGHAAAVRVDARQSNGERYGGFLRALDSAPCIVLGNRSAVYAPAHRLGAIFIWDDGDPLLAEPLAPYVHARDAALVRAEQSDAGLCFAAHSRSIEVHRLVEMGYVRSELSAPKRTRVVHADASITPDAFAGRVPEFAARTIREGLRSGPVLVQVATPGYAPVAVCADCGALARCRACAGPIGFRSAGRGACRWCGEHVEAWSCRDCGGRALEQRGMGSRRTVEQFERQFAGARVILSDGDHPHQRVDSRPAVVVATRGAEPIAAGDPLDPSTVFGAMVSAEQMQTALGYIEAAKEEGALLRLGGNRTRMETGGYYVEPTVFDDVAPQARLSREEVFGPVLAVTRFTDTEDALRLANDTPYGLAAGLWTRDVNLAHRAARAIRAGLVWVNGWDSCDITMPFGGFKQSGFGRDRSLHALYKYADLKSVSITLL